MQVEYFGWSGVGLRDGATFVGFDLFGSGASWDAIGQADSVILCVTHGHPEHVGSLRGLLESAAAQPHLARTHLVSSAPVVAHLNRKGVLPESRLHRVEAGDTATIGAVQITAFAWSHMTLLPPGLRAKGGYLTKVLRRPHRLLAIGLSGLRTPLRAPTLGFRVEFPSGASALNYSEGMHRRTAAAEVAAVASQPRVDVATFAVEPEDLDALPALVEALNPRALALYEAHRPWRDDFGLPVVDLEQYAAHLSQRRPGMTIQALTTAGQTVIVTNPLTNSVGS